MFAARKLQYDVDYTGNDMPEGRAIIAPYAEKLIQPPILAWNEFNLRHSQYAHEWTIRSRTNVLFDYQVKWAKRIADQVPEIKIWLPRKDLFFLSVENSVICRYKKLNEDLTTNNIPTSIQQKLIEGQHDNLFGEKGIRHLISIGYQFNSLKTNWENVWMVEWEGKKLVWYGGLGENFDVRDFDHSAPKPDNDNDQPTQNLRLKENPKRKPQTNSDDDGNKPSNG